jgi:hypothetical protein
MGRDEARIAESCPACGGPVECGMTNEDETCWCFALPLALPMPPDEVVLGATAHDACM